MQNCADRIKKLIDESGKSYRELEELTGITRSTLQRYANGITTKIPLEVVKKLEEAFGVPRGYIMGWAEQETTEKKPAEDDGLSENVKLLLDFVKQVPEDKVELVLRVMKSIVEGD